MNMKHVSIKSLTSKTETRISNFHTGIYLELGIFRGVLNSQNSRSSQFPGYCLLRGTERKIRRWLQLNLQISDSRNWDTGQEFWWKAYFRAYLVALISYYCYFYPFSTFFLEIFNRIRNFSNFVPYLRIPCLGYSPY